MLLLGLLAFVVVMYMLWKNGDVTIAGKAAFFSFLLHAKTPKIVRLVRTGTGRKTKPGPGPLAKQSTLDGAH
jgi:hypothetical protein